MKIKLHLFVIVFFLHSCKSVEDKIDILPTISSVSLGRTLILKTEILEAERKVLLWVPYQTDLSSIVPTILTKNASTVIPSSTQAQNFSVPVYYTLVSKSGQKIIYEVSINTMEQPTPVITGVSKDTLEAGKSFMIIGRDFGLNPVEVQASIVNSSKEILLKTELIDSSHVYASSLDDVMPGNYTLLLKVRNKSSNYSKSIVIEYPSPHIDSIDYWNVIQEESIRIYGKYFSKNYTYNVILVGKDGKEYSHSLPANSDGQTIECRIPNSIKEGEYRVKITNMTLTKESNLTDHSLVVYRNDMPYLVDTEKYSGTKVKQGNTLVFTALNFEKVQSRFYQVQLQNETETIVQNALYNAVNKRLSFEIPKTKGIYHINLILSNESAILYSINTRFVLTIE
ncbi:IPT/TIG domain-containing protein [Flectobacillus rivi]|uniref:IPT/TIG domain-containing protein n=1 Tax=Flectobacillus rivi TaxID=2984209 RepID=A0ABT6YWF0_9BACT|nr:IPT/TIG domain-containing protein [Flectobacillus rivi]MDI9873211.1 IPT/TIG domain-containing protein [Flectobacillus rivi]